MNLNLELAVTKRMNGKIKEKKTYDLKCLFHDSKNGFLKQMAQRLG